MINNSAKLFIASLLSALCLLTSVSSAQESSHQNLNTLSPAALRAPLIVTTKVGISSDEFAHYQNLKIQSDGVSHVRTAGASDTTKKVLLIVGVSVLVVGAVALIVTHGGHSAYSGNIKFQ